MKKILYAALVTAVAIWFAQLSFADCSPNHNGPAYTLGTLYAAEHGGSEITQEHGGSEITQEHGGSEITQEHGGKEHGGEEITAEGEHGGKEMVVAAEHGGKEHGGAEQEGEAVEKEHGGKEHEHKGSMGHTMPTADNIRGTMKTHVLDKSSKTGSFDVYDSETGKTRRLALVRVHERVGKTGDYYYSCADFTDLDSGELLDLDLDVEDKNGELSVVDVRIHKLNGKARYTYDSNDNRIPINN